MTAIAGAIRVEGRPVLKAFTGRARENKAAAEIEYMSSTSAEMGELFNGKGIVRTMGQSKIAQFIVFPHTFNADKKNDRETLGIHTLKSATEEGKEVIRKEDYRDELDARFINCFKPDKVRSTIRKNEVEDGTPSEDIPLNYWESLQYPNLQLNIAAKRITAERRSVELHLAAIIAIILQGVSSCDSWSTKEYKWFSNDPPATKAKHMSLFWVQGKPRVSDQEFGYYVIYAQDKDFISTSSRK
ncbi:hypothetical protein EDB82DRAFT_570054 [Fusarium venenatum]|uniref:uncharacterized protein n=1 Tax=Fusarium venenatum TaxID=56646 RepID=UPI001DA7EE9C|nr:hypothetical protein EDB82DRAFT_570054 [Fusarium venenatum]